MEQKIEYNISTSVPNGVPVYFKGKKFISGETINNYIAANCTWVCDKNNYNIDKNNDIYIQENIKRFNKELSYGRLSGFMVTIITFFLFLFWGLIIYPIVLNFLNNVNWHGFIELCIEIFVHYFPFFFPILAFSFMFCIWHKRDEILYKFALEAITYYEENQDKYKNLYISFEKCISPELRTLINTMQQYHIKCPNCGGFAEDGDKICRYCGESLKIINKN